MMNNIIAFPKGYMLRQSGNIGLEIISPTGKILAWTTDPVFGAFICRVMNDIFADEAVFGEEDMEVGVFTHNNTKGR
jgi:hypothetical protein